MTSRIANSAVSTGPYTCTEEKLTDGVALATFERQRLVLGIQRLSRNKRKLSPSF